MSVTELEEAVSSLNIGEFKKFKQWFADFDMALWDKQIEEDSDAGRLDHLIAKAMEDYSAGRTSNL